MVLRNAEMEILLSGKDTLACKTGKTVFGDQREKI